MMLVMVGPAPPACGPAWPRVGHSDLRKTFHCDWWQPLSLFSFPLSPLPEMGGTRMAIDMSGIQLRRK